MPLGLPLPFAWSPTSPTDDLLIDFIQWSVKDKGALPPDPNGYFMFNRASNPGTFQRAHYLRWTTSQPPTARGVDGYGVKLGLLMNDGNFVVHGGGCPGTSGKAPWIGIQSGTWPQLGRPMTVELHDGPLSSPAALTLGFNNLRLGATPLPIDLVIIGAPGCFMWHDSLATLPLSPTDPTGFASAVVPVPAAGGLLGARLFGTWVNIDPGANPLSITTSGYATIILGT
jgi:hypothetical protein